MSIVYMKAKGFSQSSSQEAKKNSRLKKILFNWFTAQFTLKREWESFQMSSARGFVPYRVWSRHSAYLEIHQRSNRS